MKIPVTIYSTPNCVKCESTKRLMNKLHIEYAVEDLTDPKNAKKLAEFKAQGHMTAPIVTTDVKTWSDFQYQKIQSLANHIFSKEAH